MFTLATSVALPVMPAMAAGPAAGDATAQSLYKEGKTQYEIGEYEKALELWKQAYAKVDDTPDNLQVRHALVYNIAEAEVKVYEISKDVTHLRRARTLLDRYLSNHQKLYGDAPEAAKDRADAQSKLEEIDARLAEVESQAPAPATGGDTSTPASTPVAAEDEEPDLAQQKLARIRQIREDPKLRRKDKLYTGLIWGGTAVTVVGGILLIAAPSVGVSAALNNAADDPTSGNYFRGAGGAVAVSGLLVAAGGVGMIITGTVLRKKHRAPRPAEVSFAPYKHRTGFGAAAQIRF